MRVFFLTSFLLVAISSVAVAQHNIPLAPGEVLVSVNGVAVQQHGLATQPHGTTNYRASAVPTTQGSLAQSKANRMAQSGYLGHLGGGFGGGHAEGVGMGSTREAAIRNCCYWGQRTPIDIGAASNGSRWYACVIYR